MINNVGEENLDKSESFGWAEGHHSFVAFIHLFIHLCYSRILSRRLPLAVGWGGGGGRGWLDDAREPITFSLARTQLLVGWDPSSIWVSLQTFQVSIRLTPLINSNEFPTPHTPQSHMFDWSSRCVSIVLEVYPCFLLPSSSRSSLPCLIPRSFFLSFTSFHAYVPVKSKLQHSPPGQPPGHLNFWKIFGKLPPPKAEKLFKCPIIGPFQVIKCPHPQETFW